MQVENTSNKNYASILDISRIIIKNFIENKAIKFINNFNDNYN